MKKNYKWSKLFVPFFSFQCQFGHGVDKMCLWQWQCVHEFLANCGEGSCEFFWSEIFKAIFTNVLRYFFSEFSLLWMVILWILQLCWKHRISLFVRCGLGIFCLCLLTEPKWAWRQLSQNLMRCPSRSKRGDSNTDVNWDFP